MKSYHSVVTVSKSVSKSASGTERKARKLASSPDRGSFKLVLIVMTAGAALWNDIS